MRHLWLLGGLLALGGCGLPTAVTVAGYAADVVILGATGKSSTDHLLSDLTASDCVTWRVFRGESICREVVLQPGQGRALAATAPHNDAIAALIAAQVPAGGTVSSAGELAQR